MSTGVSSVQAKIKGQPKRGPNIRAGLGDDTVSLSEGNEAGLGVASNMDVRPVTPAGDSTSTIAAVPPLAAWPTPSWLATVWLVLLVGLRTSLGCRRGRPCGRRDGGPVTCVLVAAPLLELAPLPAPAAPPPPRRALGRGEATRPSRKLLPEELSTLLMLPPLNRRTALRVVPSSPPAASAEATAATVRCCRTEAGRRELLPLGAPRGREERRGCLCASGWTVS